VERKFKRSENDLAQEKLEQALLAEATIKETLKLLSRGSSAAAYES